jgi:hypothetical protein
MTQVLPNGYANHKIKFGLSGSSHVSIITLGVQNADSNNAADVGSAIRSAFFSTSRPFALANIATGWSYLGDETNVMLAGVETFDVHTVSNAGTKSASAVPINAAVLCVKNTGVSGRRNKGRMFVPPFYFLEADVDMAGVISPTPLAAYQTLFNSAWSDLDTNNVPPVILHSVSEVAPTIITSFTISGLMATQRRRMRR